MDNHDVRLLHWDLFAITNDVASATGEDQNAHEEEGTGREYLVASVAYTLQ